MSAAPGTATNARKPEAWRACADPGLRKGRSAGPRDCLPLAVLAVTTRTRIPQRPSRQTQKSPRDHCWLLAVSDSTCLQLTSPHDLTPQRPLSTSSPLILETSTLAIQAPNLDQSALIASRDYRLGVLCAPRSAHLRLLRIPTRKILLRQIPSRTTDDHPLEHPSRLQPTCSV